MHSVSFTSTIQGGEMYNRERVDEEEICAWEEGMPKKKSLMKSLRRRSS
jgi:hypothetical protein